MKKISKLLVIIAAASAMIFVGCANASGGGGGSSGGGDDDNPKTEGEFTQDDVKRTIQGTEWSSDTYGSFKFTSGTEGTFTPPASPSIRAAGDPIGFTYTTKVTKNPESIDTVTIIVAVKNGGKITIGGVDLGGNFEIVFTSGDLANYSFTITKGDRNFTFSTPANTPLQNYVRGSKWALTDPTITWMKENFLRGNGAWFIYKVEFENEGNMGTSHYYYKDGGIIKKASSDVTWSLNGRRCVLEGTGIDGVTYEITTTGNFYVGITEFKFYDLGTQRTMTWTKQ